MRVSASMPNDSASKMRMPRSSARLRSAAIRGLSPAIGVVGGVLRRNHAQAAAFEATRRRAVDECLGARVEPR